MIQTDKVDPDKWNQIIFENANKYHLHQDNLRWLLSAGYVGFFYNGFKLGFDSSVVQNPQFLILIQFAMTMLGTLFFIVIMMEGWYYNLILAHLVKCEEDAATGRTLATLTKFDRDEVPSFHPSFACVLSAVAFCNTFFLFEFVSQELGLILAIFFASLYVSIMLYLALLGQVPRRIDATLIKHERNLMRKRKILTHSNLE